MEMPSIKKALVLDLAGSLETDVYKGNSLILFTAGGTICGTPLDSEKCKSLMDTPSSEMSHNEVANEMLYAVANSSSESYDKEFEAKHPLSGNDGYLILTNVSVKSGTCTTNFCNLVVFFDQIIGATIGNLDN